MSVRIGEWKRLNDKYIDVLERQLAVDYDCTVEEVHSDKNIFRILKVNPGARPVGNADTFLKVAVYREKLLVMADEKILDWFEKTFGCFNGVWFSEPQNLIKLHCKLQEYGHKLADAHHYYIPAQNGEATKRRFPVKWYEEKETEVFQGDGRFGEALLFDDETPDMLAVCAMEKDVVLGMAGATRDSEQMWQIGVNVTDEGRGKGVGTYVTSLLKEELLGRGIVPFYATVESHIKSQKVAIQAGFLPVFYEIFSEKIR